VAAAVGASGFLAILWLMLFKPFWRARRGERNRTLTAAISGTHWSP